MRVFEDDSVKLEEKKHLKNTNWDARPLTYGRPVEEGPLYSDSYEWETCHCNKKQALP